MGNEISTVGGAIATVGTAAACAVTFGQVDAINEAVGDCAEYTVMKADETIIRHAAVTVGTGVATIGTGIAAKVTFGQVDALEDAYETCAKACDKAVGKLGNEVGSTVVGLTVNTPVLGHTVGKITSISNPELGNEMLHAANRSTLIIAASIGATAVTLNPAVGATAGAATGAAYDGVHTAVAREPKG